MRLITALLFVSSALLSSGAFAQARIYCCDAADGRKVCGDFLPPECQGRAYVERDNRGFVSKTVEAPLTAEQQARRDAEVLKLEADAKKVAEERRRTLALLSTYSSAKNIDAVRDRNLAEIDKSIQDAEKRLEEAMKKKKKLDGEKAFYKGKALPDSVKSQLLENEKEIKAHQKTIADKAKEKEEVRNRFADEKKRYLELTGKAPAESPATKPEVVVVVPNPVAAAPEVAPVEAPKESPKESPKAAPAAAETIIRR